MTCREFAELVTGLTEGTLGFSQAARVRQHLLSCDNCIAYLAQMRQVAASLRSLAGATAEPAPDALKASLRARRPPPGSAGEHGTS
jgi:anti-sigma factor RsiW